MGPIRAWHLADAEEEADVEAQDVVDSMVLAEDALQGWNGASD